ncbi:MAG: hypothetical protein R6X13_03500 [bacterium]
MPKHIQCGSTTADGKTCLNDAFIGMYECTAPFCTVWQYEDKEPVQLTPDGLPVKKNCPGCQTLNSTFIFRCNACGTVHDFTPLAVPMGARVV